MRIALTMVWTVKTMLIDDHYPPAASIKVITQYPIDSLSSNCLPQLMTEKVDCEFQRLCLKSPSLDHLPVAHPHISPQSLSRTHNIHTQLRTLTPLNSCHTVSAKTLSLIDLRSYQIVTAMDVTAFTDQVLIKMAQFDYEKKVLTQAGVFNPGVMYWSRELQEWSHRQSMWIWVSGTVPEGLKCSRPVVLDWAMADLKSKETDWQQATSFSRRARATTHLQRVAESLCPCIWKILEV